MAVSYLTLHKRSRSRLLQTGEVTNPSTPSLAINLISNYLRDIGRDSIGQQAAYTFLLTADMWVTNYSPHVRFKTRGSSSLQNDWVVVTSKFTA